jgi:hypothetical protein
VDVTEVTQLVATMSIDGLQVLLNYFYLHWDVPLDSLTDNEVKAILLLKQSPRGVQRYFRKMAEMKIYRRRFIVTKKR